METSVSYLQVLECTACGGEFDADTVHGVCPSCGKVLFARYDLAAVRSSITPDDFHGRSWDMWRYRELLPVRSSAKAFHMPTIPVPPPVGKMITSGRH